MLRRTFLLFWPAFAVSAPWPEAMAQPTAISEADRIAEALTPRRRRGGGEPTSDPKALDVVERLRTVRQRRGLSLRELDELHVATQAMPQLDLEIYFAFNAADIDARAIPTLDSLGEALNRDALKTNTIVIAGHTDRKGAAPYNQSLSDRRAQAVALYLATTHKVEATRMLASGFGFRKLKLPNQPMADANRRVQIINVAR